MKSNASSQTQAGTLGYMAPETCGLGGDGDDSSDEDGEGSHFGAMDIWAVGIITFQMLTGTLPFPGPDLRPLGRYARGKTSLPVEHLISNGVNSDGQAFVSNLLRARPGERLTAASAREHKWFADLDKGASMNDAGPQSELSDATQASASWTTKPSSTDAKGAASSAVLRSELVVRRLVYLRCD
jgi:serine/threonine protein kinase